MNWIINKGLHFYSYDDVVRLLIGKNMLEGISSLIPEVWLPLSPLLLGYIHTLTGNLFSVNILNIALTVISAFFVHRIALILHPENRIAAVLAAALCLGNSHLVMLSVSGAAEPFFWALVLSHLYFLIDFYSTSRLGSAAAAVLLLSLACWTRPEAWIFLTAETAVFLYYTIKKHKINIFPVRLLYLILPWCALGFFFLIYYLTYDKFYWNVRYRVFQRYGIGSLKLYPLQLWRMSGGLAGAAGFLAAWKPFLKNRTSRFYLAVSILAFGLFTLSSYTAGISVLYRRTTVWTLLIFSPVIAAGWVRILSRVGNLYPGFVKLGRGISYSIPFIVSFLVLQAFDSYRNGISLAETGTRNIKEITSGKHNQNYPNILVELYEGSDQNHVHSVKLFELFAENRNIFYDRKPIYTITIPGDIHTLITENNPSIIALSPEKFKEYLELKHIGTVAVETGNSAVSLKQKLTWPASFMYPYSVFTRPYKEEK